MRVLDLSDRSDAAAAEVEIVNGLAVVLPLLPRLARELKGEAGEERRLGEEDEGDIGRESGEWVILGRGGASSVVEVVIWI